MTSAAGADKVAPGLSNIVVLEIKGSVEVRRAGATVWDPAFPNQELFRGDSLRTKERSRATLTLLGSPEQIGPMSEFEIQALPTKDTPAVYRLWRGLVYFFHREHPVDVQFNTKAVAAAVRGTEFNLAVQEDGSTVLTMLDGQVVLSNDFGQVTVGSSEQGIAGPGKAPDQDGGDRDDQHHPMVSLLYHYVMELGDDETAGQRIDPETYSARSLGKDLEKGRVPLPECIDWGVALSSALAFLHSHKLVHRDIKPGNIIFVNGAPKLADIGLVTEMDRAGMSIVGTPAFMDQSLHGTPAGDLFSLGKVLYVTATGCPPDQFPRWPDNLASDLQTAGGSTFRTIILRACGRETHQPYASVAEMHSDLQGLRSAIAGNPSAENARPA